MGGFLFADVITLFDYQEAVVSDVRAELVNSRRVLVVSPTGSGKTVMFSYIASRAAANGKRIGIFAHRVELIEQISASLKSFHVPHGIIAAGASTNPHARTYVCSAQTYARRQNMPVFDLIIVDEAHHCTKGSTWNTCLDASPDARVIGVTATPERLDGRGLRETFDAMVIGPTTRTLIDAGRLSDYRLFAPSGVDLSGVHTVAGDYNRGELSAAADKATVTGDAVKHYRKYLNGAPSAVFCVGIAHAQHVAEQFRSEGFTAAHMDGGMNPIERKRVVDDFRRGALNILTSADLISEGFDCPGMHGAIMLRPTKSLALCLQQVGRALRTCPGKEKATILDHAGNTEHHGLPCSDRDWTLDGRKKAKAAPEASTYRDCKQCFARVPLTRATCPECGAVFSAKPRDIQQVEGELAEVDLAVERKKAVSPERVAQRRARTMEGLVDLFTRQRAQKLGRALNTDELMRQKRRAMYVVDARRRKRERNG